MGINKPSFEEPRAKRQEGTGHNYRVSGLVQWGIWREAEWGFTTEAQRGKPQPKRVGS
jgi:hypothetical protein